MSLTGINCSRGDSAESEDGGTRRGKEEKENWTAEPSLWKTRMRVTLFLSEGPANGPGDREHTEEHWA